MKTIQLNGVKLFIAILLITFSLPGFSQESMENEVMNKKEQRNLEREHRLAEKRAEEEENRKMTKRMVHNQQFVLEADFIAGRTGSRYPVNSTLNFILLDSTDAVIQIGSNNGIGYNGVGGITIEGHVTKYELIEKQNKRGTSYSITMYVMSSLGTYDIQLWVSQSGSADAIIRGNFSGSVTYSGRLVPLEQSRIYKGMSTP